MMELLALAVAIVAGMDIKRVGILATAIYLPILVVGLALVTIWNTRRGTEARSALFCEGVAADLRAGSPLRDALVSASDSVGIGLQYDAMAHGGSLADIALALGEELDDVGIELEMTIKTAALSGSRAADLFDEIGSVAIAQSEIYHEVRVASSSARATVVVFVVFPVLYLVFQARSGSLARLVAAPEQRIAGVAGLMLFVVGIVVAALLLWRAR